MAFLVSEVVKVNISSVFERVLQGTVEAAFAMTSNEKSTALDWLVYRVDNKWQANTVERIQRKIIKKT